MISGAEYVRDECFRNIRYANAACRADIRNPNWLTKLDSFIHEVTGNTGYAGAWFGYRGVNLRSPEHVRLCEEQRRTEASLIMARKLGG